MRPQAVQARRADVTVTLNKHSFKRHEWLYCESRQELLELLRTYRREWHITRWFPCTIRHVLSLYWHLYPGDYPRDHHIRCIATIIEEARL